jgi:hypothetical protein
MTETLPPSDPHPRTETTVRLPEALRRAWRALAVRTLIVRKDGVDRFRLPLSIALVLALVLVLWNWPLTVAAVVLALVLRVDFVVVRDFTP